MSEPGKKDESRGRRTWLWFSLAVILLVIAGGLVVSALVGPAIGNVVDNLFASFGGDGVAQQPTDEVVTAIEDATPTLPPPSTPTEEDVGEMGEEATSTQTPPPEPTNTPRPTATPSRARTLGPPPTQPGSGGGDGGVGGGSGGGGGGIDPGEIFLETSMPPSDTPRPTATPTVTDAEPTEAAVSTAEVTPDVTPEPLPDPPPTPIGSGVLEVTSPEEVMQGRSVRVTALIREVDWRESFAPVPTDEAAAAFITPRLVTPEGGAPPPTFPPPLETLVESMFVYTTMGAQLICPASAFSGCDSDGSGQVTTVSARLAELPLGEWLVTALDAAPVTGEGAGEPLTLRVHALRDPDASPLFAPSNIVRTFTVPVSLRITATGGDAPPIALIAGVALGVLLMVGVIGYNIARNRGPASAGYGGDVNQPHIFISYRRGISWSLARSVSNSLQQRGADVFIDVDDINEGRFASTIERAIERSDYVVPILAPGTLDSAWVRREIAHALAHDKIIIPLLTEGFELDHANLPDDVRDMASHNAITVLPEFYEEAMDRLARRFLRLENDRAASSEPDDPAAES